ncbi:hypothetical protein QN277_000669 [Acacia crassicarpa]|uniref:OVATE domain-containing protein n=1 Tax=Acacia crassicarpa TaxID=499986 RepID=A0AAE1N5U7_9FABA|nr:hypothetical protein QN277_000669 [Acacia crassicarpa]
MLLTNSISNTKKFFRRTFQSFKSLFSTEYQRLPKTSSPLIIHTHPELEKLKTHQWDSQKDQNKTERRRSQENKEHFHQSPVQNKKMKMKQTEKTDNGKRNVMISNKKGRHEDSDSDSIVRNSMIEKKLRELEKLDIGNVEYVLDIEEVLHYYSRLTCPAYLEIVDNFFMQMYSEFFAPISKLPLPNQ